MITSSDTRPPVSAVIVTRNRIDMLRQTIKSIQQSTYPISEIVVSDDGSDDTTKRMLEEEFPEVIRVEGPRRGIAANHNRGLSRVTADYVLVSDDDMFVDTDFVDLAMADLLADKYDLVFAGVSEYGHTIFPNTLGFLGYANRPYQPGQPYDTANTQAFMLSRKVSLTVAYDEIIRAYGSEEIDFVYRVAAAGFRIGCIKSCTHLHLGPNPAQATRFERDGCRLYATYKRYTYVNRKPLKGMIFLATAFPHHLLSSIRKVGLKTGFAQARSNFKLACSMILSYREDQKRRASPSYISESGQR